MPPEEDFQEMAQHKWVLEEFCEDLFIHAEVFE
jgi:hypothetical protein